VSSSSTRARVLGTLVAVFATIAVALAAFLLWPLLTGATNDSPAADSTWPRIVSEAELREFGAINGPVYWAGPEDNMQYELTITNTGTFYIRYLPEGTAVGDPGDNFLSVATYPNIDGYDNLVQAGARDGATAVLTEGGALIVATPEAPLSTYFSFEGSGFQVEVFSPDEGVSMELVKAGTVEILQ
jgi:hypothetical protein